jgi:hypothetical protein
MFLAAAMVCTIGGSVEARAGGADALATDAAKATAWGAPRDGLRAGIRLVQEGPNRRAGAVRVGDVARPVCVVDNISERTITFTTFRPMLQHPTIHDAQGRTVDVWMPADDIPVQVVNHRLAPGESLDLELTPCLFAPNPDPLTDQTDRFTARVLLAEGKYRLSCMLDLSGQKQDDWSGRLATGQLDLDVLPPDRDRLTERVASALRQGADHFALKVVYSGNEKRPLRSLRLDHNSLQEACPPKWASVEIDRKQVEAIIDHLAKEGYLWRIVVEKPDQGALAGPRYSFAISLGNALASKEPNHRLRDHTISLGWTPGVRERLQRLQKVLDGRAATALGQLIAQPELQSAGEDAPEGAAQRQIGTALPRLAYQVE